MVHDVVIIGTGPAGVSAAWPLLQAGLSVLMVDASEGEVQAPPEGEYFDLRRHDRHQRDWMFGSDLRSWVDGAATSPKLRVPTLRPAFEGFAAANRIETENFAAVGSLASGGLSNAWGCGVARYDREEMAAFPLQHKDLDASFAAVSRRVGISGRADDDLGEYYGLDAWAEPAPALDDKAHRLMERYHARRAEPALRGLTLGRARLALLTSDRGARRACANAGLCLWGCPRAALYSASQELPGLEKAGAVLRKGVVVDHLERTPTGWRVNGAERDAASPVSIEARRVILAAGTLATTGIAWRTLRLVDRPRKVRSNPTAAFLLLLGSALGRPVAVGPSFGQLAFNVAVPGHDHAAYGALFSPMHFPTIEFIRHIPFSRAMARRLWRAIGPATLVGNVFLPSELNEHEARLTADGRLLVKGRQSADLPRAVDSVARTWRRAARRLGGVIMPGSFQVGQPGSDIHYAGTLPMRPLPDSGETTPDGELAGAPGVFVADAATFPALSPKPHTLTMMALADRLGRKLAAQDAGGI